MQQSEQTDAKCNIQQCYVHLHGALALGFENSSRVRSPWNVTNSLRKSAGHGKPSALAFGRRVWENASRNVETCPPPARPFFLTPTLPWLQWNLKFYEAPRDWQNVFALTRLRYIVVLFHIFYYNSGKENRSLYWGLLEAFYIEVPLYLQAPARQDTWETNLIKNKGEETLQCSLKWGKRTQGWTRYWSLLMIHSLPLGGI